MAVKRKYIKSKTVPVRDRGDLQGCEMLRIPHVLDNQLINGGNTQAALYSPETLFL
jgi:hypothetical protein